MGSKPTKYKPFLGINKAQALWNQLYNEAMAGSEGAQRVIADRLWGKAKPIAGMVEFELPEDGTATEQATAILKAVSTSRLDPDTGCQMLNAMAQVSKIREVEELAQRIEALEGMK